MTTTLTAVPANITVKQRFESALKILVDKLKQDNYVLGVVLLGSMSHDVVWDKSDIDLLIVTQEVKRRFPGLNLTQEGVNIVQRENHSRHFKHVGRGRRFLFQGAAHHR